QRISAQLPMLILIDLIYAYFLEINRESKEKIFNSYWENKKLNGYRRQKRVRKS
ncbi:phosphosugar-binding transcriptional regulator, partial [Streptococcus sp. GMD6S]